VNRGVPMTLREAQYGIIPYLATGKVLPDDTVEAMEEADAIVWGATGGPETKEVPAAARKAGSLLGLRSKYDLYARGSHGELGMWQLRPATARRFGIEVNARRDERSHVDESTRAAARYLAFLFARYNDWPLSLAAYNAGEGRVDRALAQRPGATFWELAERGALPAISRDYVPKILAVVNVVAGPASCTEALASTGRRRDVAATPRAGA